MEEVKKKLLEQKLAGLISSHRAIAEKFVYYILAINAACIGFALSQTKSVSWGLHNIILLASLFFWLISFCCGLVTIKISQLATTTNIELIKARILEESSLANQHLERIFALQKRLYKIDFLQNLMLGLGILCYIIWHIIHMIISGIAATTI